MKINHQYIEESFKLFFEGISALFAFFGFSMFLILLSFVNSDSLIMITSNSEIKKFAEQHMEQEKNNPPKDNKSQLIINLTPRKDKN